MNTSYTPNLRAILLAGSAFATILSSTAAFAQSDASGIETVIVTGTRETGLTVADSAAPITVVGSSALSSVGVPDLAASLADIVPSFNAESFGGDTSNLTKSATLRGLNPNDTLVLIDGKRRHATGNLHVGQGAFQGADTADLDLIPVDAIDHIEVLQDGAAAQYGTDAIAGVINIILKKKPDGGNITATSGEYYRGDGQTYDVSGNIGIPLGPKGFANLTLEKRFHGFSQRGAQDLRVVNGAGVVATAATLGYNPTTIAGYPNINRVNGDSEQNLTTAFLTAGYDITPDISFYANGSYGHRDGRSYENVRLPNAIIAAPGSNNPASPQYGSAGTLSTPGELVFAPNGFDPLETLNEDDYGYTGGVRGALFGWNWDLSSTYGKDIDNIGTANSANAALYIDTHTTPTNFYDGTFIAGEWTSDLDVNRNIDVGLASPLNVAFGLEGREDTYQIKAGDPYSRYKAGAASYPGFQPSDAGSHSRKNYAEYFDVAVAPIEQLQLDAAGRNEHYSDFGDTQIGKITARYDITPQWAFRGTLSTGFRAPTLQEEFYSATNVSPTSAIVQLPPNSAAAAVLGVQPLKPETSTSYSAGIVAHIFNGLSVTLDGYSISLGHRILGTGTLYGSGGAINSPIVTQAVIAHGNVLDPTVAQTGVALFLNGASTLTQGVDLAANYASDFDQYGSVQWTLAANYNQTSISNVIPNPSTLAPGVTLFNQTALSLLTNASPKIKVGLGALWKLDNFTVDLHETIYGPTFAYYSPNGGTYYKNEIGTAAITNLEISYNFWDTFNFAVGADNLFNKQSEGVVLVNPTTNSNSGQVLGGPLSFSPYGIDGGYYYGRITIPL